MKRAMEDNPGIGTFFRNLVISYSVVLVLVYLFVTFAFQLFEVRGMSMLPTLKDGDLVLVSKLCSLSEKKFHTGDIIAFFNPLADGDIVIKRVRENSEAGAGRYFVLGDNTTNSIDSREFGTVGKEKIIGKAICVIWPLPDVRSLKEK